MMETKKALLKMQFFHIVVTYIVGLELELAHW